MWTIDSITNEGYPQLFPLLIDEKDIFSSYSEYSTIVQWTRSSGINEGYPYLTSASQTGDALFRTETYTPIIKELDNNYSYYCVLFLSRPGKPKEKICSIIVNDLTFTRNYRDYNELSFTLSKNIKTYFSNDVAPFERTRHLVEQPAYSLVREGMIVDFRMYNSYTGGLSFEELYYINQPSLDDNGDKTISCIPCHQHLFEKTKLRGYDDTRKLLEYKSLNSDGSPEIPTYEIKNTAGATEEHTYNFNNYLEGGILNYILEYRLHNTWKVKYYDEKLNHLYDDMKVQLFSNIGGSEEDPDKYDESKAEAQITKKIDEIHSLWVLKTEPSIPNEDGGYQKILSTLKTDMDNYISDYSSYLYYSTQLALKNKVSSTFEEMSDALRDFQDSATLEIFKTNAIRDPQYLINSLTKMENAMVSFLSLIDYMLSFDVDYQIDKKSASEKEINTINDYIQNLSTMYHNLLDNIYAKLLVFKNYPGIFTYRSLTFESDDLSSVFKQLEESYLCMFVFDNVNQEIYIYSRNSDYNERQSNFVITPDNYAISIDYSPNFSQVATRLYIRGKDDLSIGGVNPTGQNYIDDFSYFINASKTENDLQMSEELREALVSQETAISDSNNLKILSKYNDELSELEDNYADFNTYQVQLVSALRDMNSISTDESMQRELLEEQTNKISQICKGYSAGDNKTIMDQIGENSYNIIINETIEDGREEGWYDSDISNQDVDIINIKLDFLVNIEALKLAIYNYQSPNILQNWFNQTDEDGNRVYDESLYQELTNYIIETDLDVNYLYDDKQAYYYGRQWLEYNNKIPITATIDSVNLFNNNKYFFAWEKIEDIGSYVYLSSYKDRITLEKMRFMSYTYSLSSNSIQMTFSNEEEIKDALNLLTKNVLGYTLKLSNKIDQYLSTWEDYIDKRDELLLENQDINTEINTLKDGNGNIIANGSGIVLNPLADNSISKTPSGLYVPDYSDRIDEVEQTAKSAQNIDASSLLTDGIYVDIIETNIKEYLCEPVGVDMISDKETGIEYPVWGAEGEKYKLKGSPTIQTYGEDENGNKLKGYLRPYIHIEKEVQEYREVWLNNPTNGLSDITKDECEDLTIGGNQLYWTSVDRNNNNFCKSVSFNLPQDIKNLIDTNGTIENIYRVKILASVKKSDNKPLMYIKFKQSLRASSSSNGIPTYEPYTIYGAGNGVAYEGNINAGGDSTATDNIDLTQGQYVFMKDNDSGGFVYISRGTTQQNSDGTTEVVDAGARRGFIMKDDNIYQAIGNDNVPLYPYAVVSSLTDEAVKSYPVGTIIFIGGVSS